jgi:branched-chain amino acid transport system ATP-binding protein
MSVKGQIDGLRCGLRLTGLRVRYGPLEALHGIDLTLPAHGVTLLLGLNGAGKTTLLNTIAGLLRPADGTIEYEYADSPDSRNALPGGMTDLAGTTVADRAKAGITLVPDGGGVFGRLTVAENLDLFAGPGAGASAGAGADHRAALALFPELERHLARRAGTLSGGEQQMLALSRAALTPWRLLLVDELSHGLAASLAARCYAALAEEAKSGRDDAGPGHPPRSMVLAEPNARHLLHLADHVVVLRRGEVSFAGPREHATPEVTGAAMA